MSKKLFLKVGLLLLSLSFVSCGNDSNSLEEDTSSKASTSQAVINTENSEEESIKTASPSVETTVEDELEDENVKTTTQSELFIVAGVGLNTIKDFCEFSLNDIIVSKRIEPKNLTSNSSYYDVKNKDNIYIDIILNVNNLSNESKMAEDLITARIKINNNEYHCFSLIESIDESNLEKYTSIKPLEITKIHYVAEVPITNSIGELEVILTSNGREFRNNFHLTQNSVKEITNLEKLTEEEYYLLIKEAKQRQQDYVNSIDDPKIKQSVQTPYSAAIAESSSLYIKYPTDIPTIDKALKRVLNGE